jgi:5-methylcytosine-specific restriction endonuclease McrA
VTFEQSKSEPQGVCNVGQFDHLYNNARWRARRAQQLRMFPLCAFCARAGITTLATVADHVEPHRGDRALFEGPLQSLCSACHGSDKRRLEDGKQPRPRFGVDGYPITE